jgi:RHS repeat-associated protein
MNTRHSLGLALIGAAILVFFATAVQAAVGRTAGLPGVTPDGVAAYSIPLALPPGTNGLTPALSLEYRHRSHGGLLGVGWSLGGLSQISRCPRNLAQDGVISPVQQSAHDRFCLDGQRLVLASGATYGATGAEYRSEIESFARVRSHGTAGSGPQYFVVEAADGRVLEYGATADSRIDVGGRMVSGTATARVWALNRIRDRAGNVIDFEYDEDPLQRSFRVAAIRYNGNPSRGIAPSHTLRFSYENRPANEVDLSYVAGTAIREIVRLNRIDVLHGEQVLHRFQLAYEPYLSAAGRSRLASLQECGSGGTDCLAPTALTWQDGNPGLGAEMAQPMVLSGNAWAAEDARWYTADLNGDGRDDLVWVSGPTGAVTLRYRLGTASGLGPEVNTGIAASTAGAPFDYNGDGFADILLISASNQWLIVPGGATGPRPPLATGLAAGNVIDYRGADLNGDGLGDIVWSETVGNSWSDLFVRARYAQPGGGFSATPVTLYEQGYHTGYEWPEGGDFIGRRGQRLDLDGDGAEDLLLNENYSMARISVRGVASDPFDSNFSGAIPVDMNGDGCTDVAYLHYTGRWRLRLGACGGLGWAAPELEGPAWSGNRHASAMDWNGDGKQDLLLRGASTWQVVLSAGDWLLPPANTGIPLGAAQGVAVADTNGDGLDDLLVRSSSQLLLRLHTGPQPDLLLSATDGFGVAAAFSYAPLTQPGVHVRRSNAVYPERDLQDARSVVVAVTTTDGSGLGTPTTTTYAYEGLREHVLGRGYLGFARRISTDTAAASRLSTDESYRQDFPFTGLLSASTIRQASGRVLRETSLQYAQLGYGSGYAARRYPYASRVVDKWHEAGGIHDGMQHTTVTHAVTQVDPTSGLVTDATTTTTEVATGLNTGAEHTQRVWHSAWLNDTANWCLGRPQATQVTVSHTLPGGSAVTRSFAQGWDGLRCRPTQQQVEPGSSQWQATAALTYDVFGNVAAVAVTGIGMPTRTTRIQWDSRGQRPLAVTDPLSQVTRYSWDLGRGLPLSVTDPNGLTTAWSYDALGRPLREVRPDGTRSAWTLSACTAASGCGDPAARYRLRADEQAPNGATYRQAEQSLDQYGRWVVSREQQANGALAQRLRRFDTRGRLQAEQLPHWVGAASSGELRYSYDLLDRLTGEGLYSAAGATERAASYEYRGLTMTQRDAAQRATTRVTTAWGDVASVTDAAGGQTRYQHDAAGRLTRVVDAYNNVVGTATWNPRGMKLAQTDMSLGTWTFTLNALGELISQRDAKGQQASFTYDALSRPLTRSEAEGTTTWTWGRTLDNSSTARYAGRLKRVAGPGYSEQYTYDYLGRPSTRSITSDATYQYAYAYNLLGQLDSLTYPASSAGYRLKLGYEYAYGHLNRIRDFNAPATSFWRLNAVDAAGGALDQTLGASLRVVTGISPTTGAMEYRQAGWNGGSAIQNLSYRWDAQGNLTERQDLNRAVTERFTYDSLDRVDDVRRNGVLSLDLSYDLIGNIATRSDVGSYSYHPTKKHALTAAGPHRYGYDANGNMSSRNGASVGWTSYNLPNVIALSGGNTSSFAYGPDRQRWRQVATTAGSTETTIYVGGLMEKVTRGTLTSWKHYVQSPEGSVALHLRYSNGSTPATYLLTQDVLGSTDKVVAASGAVVVAASFDSFGRRRGSSWTGLPTANDLAAIGNTTRDGFTGHEHLDTLELIHMNGRVYDPVVGRFMSADPVVQAPFFSQDLNRYSYAWNNPLRYVDPSGYNEAVPCLADQGRCAAVTVTGLREFPSSLAGLSSLQLAWLRSGANGQPASAWERDPCGQDGSAQACQLSGRGGGQSAPVAVATTNAGSTLDYFAGLAARVGNIGMSAVPVFWLFDGSADFEWFSIPASAQGRRGALFGEAAYLSVGIAGIARATGKQLPNAGGVVRQFVQPTDRVYYRVFSEKPVGSYLTSVEPRTAAWAQEALALPPWNKATYVQEVLVPTGTRLQRSRTIPMADWGRARGGAEQFELLDRIPTTNFGPGKPLP